MFKLEYLAERIKHHGDCVLAYVLAHDRALNQRLGDPDKTLALAAQHAAIFNALTAIAAGK